MEIIHHVSFGDQHEIEPLIGRLGLHYRKLTLPGNSGFLATFDIAESNPCWPAVNELIRLSGLFDLPRTTFSRREVLEADWLRMLPTFEKGYPQPEDSWKQITFENGCQRCSVGLIQTSSFRIAGEPILGKNHFLSLYWATATFAVPSVFRSFQAAGLRGYEQRPVIIYPSGKNSETISQLYVPAETSPGLADEGRFEGEAWKCPNCGYSISPPIKRGKIAYRRQAIAEGIDFARSHEWFGGVGHQELFVSRRVAELVVKQDWRGVTLHPLALI